MKYGIAIIGPKDVVSVFKATGADVFESGNGKEALEVLRQIKKDTQSTDDVKKFAVVLIIESLLQEISDDDYEKVSVGALPAIVAIPGLEGATGVSREKLRRLAERAIGSDIGLE
jgi:V/A-type H+-transporting ATPase subunit F